MFSLFEMGQRLSQQITQLTAHTQNTTSNTNTNNTNSNSNSNSATQDQSAPATKLLEEVFSLATGDGYAQREINCLERLCDSKIAEYYAQLGHSVTNESESNGAERSMVVSPDQLVSLQLILSLTHASKESIERCEHIAHPSELPLHITSIFSVLLRKVCLDYICYACDFALKLLPPSDPKSPPNCDFLKLVK